MENDHVGYSHGGKENQCKVIINFVKITVSEYIIRYIFRNFAPRKLQSTLEVFEVLLGLIRIKQNSYKYEKEQIFDVCCRSSDVRIV
jgi:hypothetical protein